ncbi:MAG: aconitate hydratase [Marine Group III euryarchaeote CG-Bathy1]|uniref:aconitate hydratase n=1 Tax=Marine Group III euryarchaeote CG-Bathy1 TaxID=1889001 RepID=A0A1J5T990_9ARCH|nr:MAG: aconitate hydratase [Marine Group III euryarchaeote CG-Bathy1]
MLDADYITNFYTSLSEKINRIRHVINRPLTLSEKILYSHLSSDLTEELFGGKTYSDLSPDRVAMQDATAQMALLQFSLTGRESVAVPSTVHCDHLIRAHVGRNEDLITANQENDEVYSFLKSASSKWDIGFWEPGSGIIHQVVLENYAFPGGMMIGTDSHTPNGGGLGMIAIGCGGADATEVMAGLSFNLKWPKTIGVRLSGELKGWSSPKDVILKVCEILTVKGGTGSIVEYFGPGTKTISCTGKGTICNMGAEVGATTSIFPYDERMASYLNATNRSQIADLANNNYEHLRADPEVESNPDKYYDQLIEIDLSTLEPMVVGPHTPDLARSLSDLEDEAKENNWPTELKAALIGSCTNSSYEDMERAASIAQQALDAGLVSKTPFLVTPGSDQIDQTIRRDGQMEVLSAIGGTVLANACGPCIGQWKRDDVTSGQTNTIISSYNRNFSGRNDGNHQTLSFLASPEIVTALALAGRLDFNPNTDSLPTDDGQSIMLKPPTGKELPENGFEFSSEGYIPPSNTGADLVINPNSERLQSLEPFSPSSSQDLSNLPILLKVEGKCTTDHVSPAGPWLRYRGHLDNISDNCYTGAYNVFADEQGVAINQFTGEKAGVSTIARQYKESNQGWAAIADINYGEGSSREHAAMSPRFLGCKVLISRSIARIAETNLKKQGVLALLFDNPESWHLLKSDDRITISGIEELAPGSKLTVRTEHSDGTSDNFTCNHSMNNLQIEWFNAGSAMNYLRNQ